MALNIHLPESTIMKPHITVLGVGGAGGNATNNMFLGNLEGVNFIVANTDAQALAHSVVEKRIQLGQATTKGLGAGAAPEVGRRAAEEALEEIVDHLKGSNMVFITAGMGGGTGTGAAPVIAKAAREAGVLTVGVVTKPFHFEGPRRMKIAEEGLEELHRNVDTLIVIPNQNLFRIANEKTTFADAFKLADDVLHSGVRGVTDLMVMPGLINLDFADVKAVMCEMGKAMMGTGEAAGEKRAQEAAEAAISNPLLDNVSMKGAKGVLINITGGSDMTLFEVDEAANRIREEVDPSANIIFGSTFNDTLEGKIRVSVVATGIDSGSYGGGAHTGYDFKKTEAKIEEPAEEEADEIEEESEEELTAEASYEEEEQYDEDDSDDYVEEDSADEADEDDYEDEKDRAALRNFSNYNYQNIVSEVEEDEFAPSNEDKKYFETIQNLNEEYKAQQQDFDQRFEEELARQKQQGKPKRVFVSPAPARPSNYVETETRGLPSNMFDFQDDKVGSESGSKASASKKAAASGGLFSRVARAARSFQGSEAEENYGQEQMSRAEEEAKVKAQENAESLDIPAFLRRKA